MRGRRSRPLPVMTPPGTRSPGGRKRRQATPTGIPLCFLQNLHVERESGGETNWGTALPYPISRVGK